MTYEAIPARFARQLGWRATATVRWGECPKGDEHVGQSVYASGDDGTPEGVPSGWQDFHPAACDNCGEPFVELEHHLPGGRTSDHRHSGGCAPVYDTPSGRLEPGCLFWADWIPHTDDGDPKRCWTLKRSDGTIERRGWSNCDGRHLMAVCPGGAQWDIDSRASNCTMPDDTLHRCWVRTGDPEAGQVDVGKDGHTCSAGAGSIVAGDYHGFLRAGVFTAG